MERPESSREIKNFLTRHGLAVLSTVSERGLPNAAPIFFVVDKALQFFFITPEKTQKYTDVVERKDLVLTITDEAKKETLMVRGKGKPEPALLTKMLVKYADLLNHGGKLDLTLPAMKHPDKKTVVRVQPTIIRLRRYTAEGLEEFTLKFPARRPKKA